MWESRAVDGGRDFQRLWEGPGAGGGGPELSTSGQLPQPGWGKLRLRLPGRPQGVAYGPVQACVRVCVAACGPTCRPACGFPEPRADLRAGLREPRADLRAALRGPDSAAPTPLRPLRIASLADGEPKGAERNLGRYWRDGLKFSHCTSEGLEPEATTPCVSSPRPGG
jgi:hypothetical protein